MTLRAAIGSANSSAGPDVITFDPSVFPAGAPATIALASALPVADGGDGLTIDGSGAGVIVDGSAHFDTEAGLRIQSQAESLSDVTLRDFTVRGFLGDGISVCGGGPPACEGSVTRFEATGVESTGNGGNGVAIAGGAVSDVRLEDCSASMNSDYGVLVESSFDATDIQVVGCAADGNGEWGLFVQSMGNIIDFGLTDSSVHNNGGLGAYLDSVEETIRPVIDNVEATGNGQMGIGFSAAGPLRELMFVDSTVDGNGSLNGNGLGTEVLAAQIIDATVVGNSFSNNVAAFPVGGVGFQIYSQFARPSGLTITNNTVHGNVGFGISIITDTPGLAPAALSVIADNEVSGNTSHGVSIRESGPVTISQNRIFGNEGIGIDLKGGEPEEDQSGVTPNDPGDGDEGSNELLNFPLLTGLANDSVQGTACNGCTVELFESDGDPTGYGEGRTFIAEATVSSGAFAIPVSGLCAGDEVTATATDAVGNTSEFSANYPIAVDTPGCGPALLWGDVDCSGAVNPVDSLKELRFDAGLIVQQAAGCPAIGTAAPAGVGGRTWGDVDCNGTVNPVDSLKILRFDAGLSVAQEPGCPGVGEQLQSLSQRRVSVRSRQTAVALRL
jgi:hypothetical protein